MKVPLSWIRDFTPADAPADELVAALNQLGLEVEGVEAPGGEITRVVAAKVLDVVAHPKADKLILVDIDYGGGQTRVVCGARNVVAGMLVPYAPAGATLPGGVRLERKTLRGVTSDGMLCSAKELGVGEDHRGILELPADTSVGADIRELLGLDDVVFDLAITPNRPDAMCVVGVARELAAHFGWPLDVPEPRVPTDTGTASGISVVIDAPDRCPRYVARTARVALAPSPAWMQQRLVKAGMRPISNVVDATNYVLLERNQPLHAFDLSRLGGRGVLVRLARAAERITTLDGVERTLAPEDLVICDAESAAQAIAGIMGGSTAEVGEATTEILLESAYFERMGIARTARRLKLRSEASARFERGIDPDAVAAHADRAMELLAEVAGAAVAPETVDEYPRPFARPRIRLRTDKVNGVLGTRLGAEEVRAALEPLGIAVEDQGGELVATAPSFRPDLEREIDLVEEVARRVGFDQIGRTVPKPRDQVGALSHPQRDRRTIADALVGAGLSEAITLPLVATADLTAAGAPVDRLVEVANPLRAEEAVLRTRLLPGLLRVVAANQARGLPDVAVFEIGRVFLAPGPDRVLPDELHHVAAALAGSVHRSPVEADRPVDVYDAVDALRAVLDGLEIADTRLTPADTDDGFHATRRARVTAGGVELGVVGEVAAPVCDALGVAPPAVAFELDLDVLLPARRRDRAFRPPSPYPPSIIDLAFVLDDTVPAAEVAATLEGAGEGVLEEVRVFDEFRSERLGAGRRSLAFSLRFRAPDRTLTDGELAGLRRRAIEAVARTHGGELRG